MVAEGAERPMDVRGQVFFLKAFRNLGSAPDGVMVAEGAEGPMDVRGQVCF